MENSQDPNGGTDVPAIHLVPFHDDTLVTLERGGVHYVAMRRVVENMGMSWGSQRHKLDAQPAKFRCVDINTHDASGRRQDMFCMPVERLQIWLATINPYKVRVDLRDKVERYQAESAIALHDYWTKGVASRGGPDAFDGIVTGLSAEARIILGGIVKSIVHKEVEGAVTAVCGAVIAAIMPDMLKMALASQTMIARRGRTAGQLLREYGFPPLKGLAPWFGNKMEKLGYCAEGEGRADHGDRAVRIFDPDRVRVWLREGGREIVERKIEARRGQKVIRLVPPVSEAERTY